MRLYLITIAILWATVVSARAPRSLYPISEGNLWGYINVKGEIVIPPAFYAAQDFSEGLAAVRQDGFYGFIDTTGHFVVPPAYSYATEFHNGVAQVFIDTIPNLIDDKGNILFRGSGYKELTFLRDDKWGISTVNNKFGIISKTGKVLLDTIADGIESNVDSLIVLVKYDRPGKKGKTALINIAGKYIIPWKTYDNISYKEDHYWEASKSHDTVTNRFILDDRGHVVFQIPKDWAHFADYPYFQNGVFVFQKYLPVPLGVSLSTIQLQQVMIVDGTGKMIATDPSWENITRFENNRAFVKKFNGGWYLINTKGQYISDTFYQSVMSDNIRGLLARPFVGGLAIVEKGKFLVAIDTNGNIVKRMSVPLERYSNQTRNGNLVFFRQYPRARNEYSIWDIRRNVIIDTLIYQMNEGRFNEPLVQARLSGGGVAYVDQAGKIAWQQKPYGKGVLLNMDRKAGVSLYIDRKSFDNKADEVSKLNLAAGKIHVVIDTTTDTLYDDVFKAYKVYVINNDVGEMVFDKRLGGLAASMQALDKDGLWKDIEYVPVSWCGNSYDEQRALRPGEYWKIVLPQYSGSYHTKLRLWVKTGHETLYSNEINGSINLQQFFRVDLWPSENFWPKYGY